jgi:dipeptidyl aminopeptidase/acylaminoacyl peptidase
MTRVAPYGSWASPITAEIAAGAAISFSGLGIDGANLYWLESRPAEGGRCAVVRRAGSGAISEQTLPGFNVRSTVHEYGGGAFAIDGRSIFFVNFSDQRIYRQDPARGPVPLTPEGPWRHADIRIDRRRRRLLCVREDHAPQGEPTNSIVTVAMDGSDCRVLVSGNDFYSDPHLSPDGAYLAYLTWNHPNMPWDGCELRLADVLTDGAVGPGRRVAGGSSEAIFQPEWSPGGRLHFVSDSTGWWNLYHWTAGSTRALCPMAAEFGRAMWSFGSSTYGFAAETRVLCCYTQRGVDRLAWLDTSSSRVEHIESQFTQIDLLRCNADHAAFIGASPTLPSTVVRMDFHTGRLETIRPAFEANLDPACISEAVAIEWISSHGNQAHGLYYAPTNPGFGPSKNERPPLIVLSHSGPTSAASTALRYPLQFWTSRGIAVLQVNYSGSTGYGREYRQRLNGQWGVMDVEDCCTGALFLARRGEADPARLAIKGGSAGGYTALSCLTFGNQVFAAGSAHYGIADLELMARHTHKFESHYLDTLIGPYPERRDLYEARSPIRHLADLRGALILFQGDDDRVVPPAQSQSMFEAVRQKGLPTAFLRFSGEGHGFRRADTLKRVLEAELYFLSKIFAFAPHDDVPPITIENLPDQGE